MDSEKLFSLLLRLSLTSVFVYAATASLLNPGNWIGFFPSFLTSLLPSNILLPLFSLYEIVLAFWILWGRKLFFSSLLASLTLGGIIVFNLNLLDIIFRDFAIFLVALALAVKTFHKKDFKL